MTSFINQGVLCCEHAEQASSSGVFEGGGGATGGGSNRLPVEFPQVQTSLQNKNFSKIKFKKLAGLLNSVTYGILWACAVWHYWWVCLLYYYSRPSYTMFVKECMYACTMHGNACTFAIQDHTRRFPDQYLYRHYIKAVGEWEAGEASASPLFTKVQQCLGSESESMIGNDDIVKWFSY